MELVILTLASALAISVVAAYFSIAGLIAIFAAAPIPIAVMGGTLEIAKLVSASWAYRNWSVAPVTIKYYLTIAVVILSLITSMGIFGYLSKAHIEQSRVTGDVISKIAIYDEKIKTEKENIEANRKALKQMDEGVDQILGRSTDEKGAEKAVAMRKSQQKERTRLQNEILQSQKSIAELNDARAPIATEVRKVEVEVGPLKYIAELFYDNVDNTLLDKTVRWVIILIVLVFDPLAILLLIAANISLRSIDNDKPQELNEKPPAVSITDFVPIPSDPITNWISKPSKETPPPEPPKPEPVRQDLNIPIDSTKEGWSKELFRRIVSSNNKSVEIDKSRIHSIPKEILDKVFKK